MQCALTMAVAIITSLGLTPVSAGAEEGLGGGSDIRSGSVVELTSGAVVGPIHHVFADNPGTAPIDIEFRAETPPGVTITPELERFTLQPSTSIKDSFTLTLDPSLPPGDYPVSVLLVRADISSQPGQVTNIPAVGTSFTVRVSGASGTVTVQSRSIESGLPVVGTIVLSALTGTESAFEVSRADADTLTHTVAPGRYLASFILDGRELATQEAAVAEGQAITIDLDVNTVSFVIVDAQPVVEDERVVVANLSASLDNHLQPIAGAIAIRVLIYRDDQHIDTATLLEGSHLAIGVANAVLTYRPSEGFQPGEYRFEYELVTDEFTLRSPSHPSFIASEPPASNTVDYIVTASAAALGVVAVAVGMWLVVTKKRRLVRN